MTETTSATRTVVGLFDTMEEANQAALELEQSGISRSNVSVIAANEAGKYADYSSGTGEVGKGVAGGAGAGAAVGGGLGLLTGLTALAIPGFGPVIAAGPIAAALTGAGIGAATGGLIGGLSKAGVSEDDARDYEEAVRRGGVLLTVRTTKELSDDAADILDDNGAHDIDKKKTEWAGSGYIARGNDSSTTMNRGADSTHRHGADLTEGERSIPVVEESLKVGKRDVGGRGVRVYAHVSEQPVEETVNLREEHIRVDRRPANRPATEQDFEAFREGSIDLTETREEAVVSKDSRVVEEVVVGKSVDSRKQTVRDSVRKTDVRVEETGNRPASGQTTSDTVGFDTDYRNDYKTRYANRGRDYEYYAPAYQFGSTFANESRYRDRDWTTAEPELRRDWETRGQGAWDDFKDNIRYGWDRVRGKR